MGSRQGGKDRGSALVTDRECALEPKPKKHVLIRVRSLPPLPSGVGGVSSKAAASIFVPSIAVPSRPPRSFWISQIYRSSVPLSLSLSRPHLANDEAHALYHGYACSESTSASLRPKLSIPADDEAHALHHCDASST